VLLTSLLLFLATEGSRILEKKTDERQVSKIVFSHLKPLPIKQPTFILRPATSPGKIVSDLKLDVFGQMKFKERQGGIL